MAGAETMKTLRARKQSRKRRPTSTVIRVIRRINTQEYFASDGWTSNPEDALPFADLLEAAQAVVEYRLTGVEVALRMAGAGADFFCTALR
jgi:hypothetical protein